MESWILYISAAIIFFVMGQVFLKYENVNALTTCCYFTISMGIVGFLALVNMSMKEKKRHSIPMYAIVAGILFFFGNLMWILSIKSAPSLSLIRTIMAGGETLLLLIAGYIIFKETKISMTNLFGILLILTGISLIA